jgi:hypothetical protein
LLPGSPSDLKLLDAHSSMPIRTFPCAARNASAAMPQEPLRPTCKCPQAETRKNLKGSGPSFGSIARGEGGDRRRLFVTVQVTLGLTFVLILVTRQNLVHRGTHSGCDLKCGASAVLPRGLATRAGAASGIIPFGTTAEA